jgi:hypothetical protein
MAETLLCILLVTSSPKGTQVAFHWPPFPSGLPRLARPKPQCDAEQKGIDGFWLAATGHEKDEEVDITRFKEDPLYEEPLSDTLDYEWKRPTAFRNRSRSFAGSTSRPSSRRASPSKDHSFDHDATYQDADDQEYNSLFGYPAELLARALCAQRAQCHQKFELIVDDLAFIGHPVSVGTDGTWKFKDEKRPSENRRGRGARQSENGEDGGGTRNAQSPLRVNVEDASTSEPEEEAGKSILDMFHLVLVIDLPDPSSSASGNLFKYFHVIYEHIAFTVTAVLFQEQVTNQFIEKEFEALTTLREQCVTRGELR